MTDKRKIPRWKYVVGWIYALPILVMFLVSALIDRLRYGR